MKRYLLDTNIALAYIRGNPLYMQIESELNLTAPDAQVLISVVSKAELMTLGRINSWGEGKIKKLDQILAKFLIIDIREADQQMMNAYMEIDAFSRGKLFEKPLGMSARTMGKNDLWIAATTLVTQATLVTTDKDFDHLNPAFVPVKRYEI